MATFTQTDAFEFPISFSYQGNGTPPDDNDLDPGFGIPPSSEPDPGFGVPEDEGLSARIDQEPETDDDLFFAMI